MSAVHIFVFLCLLALRTWLLPQGKKTYLYIFVLQLVVTKLGYSECLECPRFVVCRSQ